MKNVLSILLMFVAFSGSFAQENSNITVVEPIEYRQQIEQDSIQFVDVRTPKEYEAGHIEGAENINFLAEGFLSKMEKFDKEKPLLIYCRSGNRSAKAAAKLSEMGFKEIIDLKGGYVSWERFQQQ